MNGTSFTTPVVRPVIQNENDLLRHNLAPGQEFEFKGRIYKVISDQNKLAAADQSRYEMLETFYGEKLDVAEQAMVNFSDRINDFSFSSREARLSQQLMPADKKHFRVDVDKTLLYRGVLPEGKDRAKFEEVTLHHTRYGKTNVFINTEMVEFFKEQKASGARVSITSTGGWAATSSEEFVAASKVEESKPSSAQSNKATDFLSLYLLGKGLALDEFDNKKTVNTKSGTILGVGQKFKALKDTDSDGRWNIMIDDQWHQRTGFTYSIDAAQFGMG